MDFLIKLICGFIVTSYLYKPATADEGCNLRDRINFCTYTVFCNIYPGSVNNPGCNGTPNVTFIIVNSSEEHLTYGFFGRTNFDSRVRNIIANNNVWTDIQPNAFKYYKYSINVDLSHNNIYGIEDGAFLGLRDMKYLNLSHNALNGLTIRTFEVIEGSTGTLEVLDLSNNYIFTLRNDVFTHYPNLQKLYLQNNKIDKLAENCFNNLKNLNHLIIRNNKICGINMTLALLTELTYLDISQNCVQKLLGFEMIRLLSLQHLNMSYNNIESIDHASFSQVSKLEVLDLSHNNISTMTEEDMFSNNHRLVYLDIYDNNITSISSRLFQHNSIQYLNLQKNNITGNITGDLFKGLNLTDFNITYQHIEAIKNNAFSEMENLKYLNLSHNFINNIENSSFVNASTLIVLDISYNKIEDVYFFQYFTSDLSDLYINNNNIVKLLERTFENHRNLKALDISNNALLSVGQNALPLNNLQYLKINYNNLTGTVVDKVFSPAKLLRHLDLSHFNLGKLNDSAIVDLPLVLLVNLSHNHINFIQSSNFKGLNEMITLDLSFNDLTEMALETKLENLQQIYLNNNNFTRIPNIFGNESILTNIDVSQNKISNLTDATFNNLRNLLFLNLSHNNITLFNNEYTNLLNKLIVLKLASNHIKEMINMTFYNDLQEVDVSNNEISYIDSSQLNVPFLKDLSLSNNQIKVIKPGTFQYMNSLKVLDLSSNDIKNVPFGSFRGLNKTTNINLSKNKISYLQVEVFHECYELNTLIIDYNYITSLNIETVVKTAPKLELLSIGGNPIACEEIIWSNHKISHMSHSVRVSLTSIHKIYHEDNVHGVKCGNSTDGTNESTTTKAFASKSKGIKEKATESVLYIWCGILSAVIVIGLLGFYVHKRHANRLAVNRESRMQFQNSANSECYSDLLN